MKSVTCTAPVNIAVVKYWGKRDEEFILPINCSLSVTLSQDQLCAKTTVAASSEFTEDRIWLNGKEEDINNKRLQNVLKEVKRIALKRSADSDEQKNLIRMKVHICSENNFPTAAGLASSAAGYACLVFTLSKLFGVDGNVSKIARVGSGSACRSMYGGFVAWRMGSLSDGSDSLAEQIAPNSHWPQLKALILVVSVGKKVISSTAGMGNSVKTSKLLKYRSENIVPVRMSDMEKSVLEKDFTTFAKLTMQDSNQFHATCLDTFPPIFYLNDVSRKIINLVHAYNDFHQQIKVAYTFDAGPNACIYMLEDDVAQFGTVICHYFPSSSSDQLEIKGIKFHSELNETSQEFIRSDHLDPVIDGLSYIISTEVGDDPRVLDQSESLLGNDGLPERINLSD